MWPWKKDEDEVEVIELDPPPIPSERLPALIKETEARWRLERHPTGEGDSLRVDGDGVVYSLVIPDNALVALHTQKDMAKYINDHMPLPVEASVGESGNLQIHLRQGHHVVGWRCVWCGAMRSSRFVHEETAEKFRKILAKGKKGNARCLACQAK